MSTSTGGLSFSRSPSLTTNILESDKHCTPLNLNNQPSRRNFNPEKKLVQAPKNKCRDSQEALARILKINQNLETEKTKSDPKRTTKKETINLIT